MSVLANFTIKIRLMVIAIVIALALLVLFVMTLSNASLLSDVGLTLSKVERLESGVLTLRRNEKDFLARKDLKYLDTFQANVAKLGANHKYVEGRILEYGLDIPEIRSFERAYVSYAEQFNALVEYQKKIGLHPKDGYYGDLRAAVHNVEEILKSQNSYKLLSDMLQLRRAEKDFMLRRDTKYLDKFEANLSVFNQHLDSESLDNSIKQSIRSGLERYNTQFKQLVDAEVKIGLDSKSGLLGDLRATIHQTDKSLAVMVTTLKEAMDERAAVSKLNAIIVFVLSTLVVAFIIYNVSQSILKPVMAVKNAVAYIRENNDLTWLVRSKGKDELVEMADDVNSLITDFRQLITNVNNALHTLDNATEELASNTQNTLDGMDKQFQESDMVATSGAEMQATVADINQNTQIATATANKTGELASAGSDEVNLTAKQITELSNDLKNALVQIEKLESDSQLIGTVSDSIRGIAEQTNLLALNAAIEAARAGEQGRGFAVVADEVRSLAMRTQESTSEIESIISSLQTSTQTIVGVVNQCYQNGIQCSEQAQLAGASLNQISEHVNEVVEMNSQISSSLAEQDEVATSMSAHVIQIRDIAEESQTRAATNAQASQDIAKQAAVLHAEIERYKTVR